MSTKEIKVDGRKEKYRTIWYNIVKTSRMINILLNIHSRVVNRIIVTCNHRWTIISALVAEIYYLPILRILDWKEYQHILNYNPSVNFYRVL